MASEMFVRSIRLRGFGRRFLQRDGTNRSGRRKKGGAALDAVQGEGFETSVFGRQLSTESGCGEKIVAAVVLERLPVILPHVPSTVSAFRNFSFEWQQQYRRHYPQEFLDACSSRGEDDENAAFEPAPTETEADRTNDRRSLQRALDQRLYLILNGFPLGSTKGNSIWHFPEKQYANESTLRECAELALSSVGANSSSSVFFVGNAPCGYLLSSDAPDYKLLANQFPVAGANFRDYAWISKKELSDYFEPDHREYLQKMLS